MQTSERMRCVNTVAAAFVSGLSKKLSALSDEVWTASIDSETSSSGADGSASTIFRFRILGTVNGEAFASLRKSDVPALKLNGLRADASDDETSRVMLAALQEVGSGVATAMGEYGVTSVEVEPAGSPVLPDGEAAVSLRSERSAATLPLVFYFDDKLLESLQSLSTQAFPYQQAGSANLDLVLDVALNVTLRFGQRQLALREVLDLTSGSVVELDRQVDEPVELVLDGRVVARGEAVIIDGNYGMRITQVLQPIVA